MFELLQAYETAKHEKNKVLRFFYTKYVRHKLKTSFFDKLRYNIYHMNLKLDRALIDEFIQFYRCVFDIVKIGEPEYRPYLIEFSQLWNINIACQDNNHIRYRFLDDSCDIEVIDYKQGSVIRHLEYDAFYISIYAEILIIAIYNYCVSYIYGSKSKLFIEDDTYMKNLRVVYL